MAVIYKQKDESIESMLARFKKAVKTEGTLQELRKREYYLSPSEKQKIKSEEAQKRYRMEHRHDDRTRDCE